MARPLLSQESKAYLQYYSKVFNYPILTTDFFYIRFIGNRSIDEKDFGAIQKDREKEMQKWAQMVKKVKEKVLRGMVPANNHYAGFGPATANGFRKLLEEPTAVWEEMKQARLDSRWDANLDLLERASSNDG